MIRPCATLAILAFLAACQSTGPVMDPDRQAMPIESIAEPSDGIANER